MEIIGWASSFILVLTLFKQVHKQWQDDTSRGVSPWLYIGELASNAGFIVYSWSVGNWVFVVTNVMIFLSSILGLWITYRHKQKRSIRERQPRAA